MTAPRSLPSEDQLALHVAIDSVCVRVAPTWPLDRFIAVNPLWGHVGKPLPEVAARMRALAGYSLTADRAYFRDAWREGRILPEHLAEAAARAGRSVEASIAWLDDVKPGTSKRATVLELVDAEREVWPSFREHVVDAISRHCARHFAAGAHEGLYAAWRRARDLRSVWLLGLRADADAGDAKDGIARALEALEVPSDERVAYMTSVLSDVAGWAAWCAYRRWTARLEGSDDDAIVDLLAIRLAWEQAALAHGGRTLRSRWTRAMQAWPAIDEAARRDDAAWVWQDALELAYRAPLARRLAQATTYPTPAPAVQAAFCIDVRSEVFRRALEAQSPRVATIGFAGFFGMPIEYRPLGADDARPQLPGPLAPRLRATDVGGTAGAAERRKSRLGVSEAWAALRSGSLSSFAYVDALGPFYAGALALRTLRTAPTESVDEAGLRAHERGKPRLVETVGGEPLDVAAKCDLAAGMLRAMSLTEGFARLVLLAGHGSATANNAHAAGYDCGACCGQTGEVNARAAAALLNDPAVRRGLAERGIVIGSQTWFVAGLHVTTTDALTLFDLDELPASHEADVATLRAWLEAAGNRARAERAARLGLAGDDATLADAMARRAGDWSEVRPEWGLARNAAFVIAPRARTKSLALDGRVFLHDYVAERDEGFATLELLLTAPMVVTHWINFQYYASTVEPRRLGSGNKVLHDVVGGTIGVFEGNGGDLRIGLPLQSLHDGTRWVHEPLRLSVFVEAPEDAIEAVIAKHATVRDLVEGGWLYLCRLEGDAVLERHDGGWVSVG
ncbi:MAG: DUF2309 domain-containing protein [Sandaracinus sp.]|nr:DUF2309 domain-containing protein [Sandaracinus sp.]